MGTADAAMQITAWLLLSCNRKDIIALTSEGSSDNMKKAGMHTCVFFIISSLQRAKAR